MLRTSMLIVAGSLGFSVGLGNANPPEPSPEAKLGRILIWKEEKILLLTPDGKQISEAPADRKKYALLAPDGKSTEIPYPDETSLTDPCVSPDGKRVAFIASERPP